MRILIGISYFTPNLSGLTVYARELANELARKGHKVTVLTSRYLKTLPGQETKEGVVIKRAWTPFLLGRGPVMPTYPIAAIREVRKSDVVNCHIPQFEAVFLAFFAKIFKKKIIVTHHCDLSDWPGLINQITEKVAYISLLITGFLADTIVVYTKDYAEHSQYLSKFKDKLVYTLPPVRINRGTEKLSLKYKSVAYKIGFAGRIAREKGIPYLLAAIPFLKKGLNANFKIFLAGPSREVIGGGFEKEIQTLLQRYKGYLVFLGPIEREKMEDFYKQIDVLVLPSTERLESFGFVQVEAMLAGCPVVASNIPGVRVPIKLSGMGEIVQVKNSEFLAQGIVKVINNKKKYIKSQRKIKEIFNYQKTLDLYEELFKNLS